MLPLDAVYLTESKSFTVVAGGTGTFEVNLATGGAAALPVNLEATNIPTTEG